MLPKSLDSLLVACRGASLISIAASSCRLSRTMMLLGHAAGVTAALGKEIGAPLRDVRSETLREILRSQHDELGWPRRASTSERLKHAQAPVEIHQRASFHKLLEH